MKNPRAQLAGAIAASAGKTWEKVLELAHANALERRLVVHVAHNQPRAALRGARLVFAAASAADYVMMAPGGLTVAVEAKSTSGARFYLTDVSETQRAHLDAVATHGGVALLALELRRWAGEVHRFVCPWERVPWKALRSARSVDEDDLGGWEMIPAQYLARFLVLCESCSCERRVCRCP